MSQKTLRTTQWPRGTETIADNGGGGLPPSRPMPAALRACFTSPTPITPEMRAKLGLEKGTK